MDTLREALIGFTFTLGTLASLAHIFATHVYRKRLNIHVISKPFMILSLVSYVAFLVMAWIFFLVYFGRI